MPAARRSPASRFWPKVKIAAPDACWLWTGAQRKTSGYGSFWSGERIIEAHRFAYELTNGPIPEGLVIDHLCRTKLCVNPAHLEAVTPRENNVRGVGFAGINVRKTHCPQGHPYEGDNLRVRVDAKGREQRICKACDRQGHRVRAAGRSVALVALLALAIGVPTASAHKQAPAPGGSCNWQQNGLELDGWVCLCQRVKFRTGWQVWCAWHLADTVDGAITSKKSKPKKPAAAKVRVLVRPVIA